MSLTPDDRSGRLIAQLAWVLARAEALIRDQYGTDAASCFTDAWGEVPHALQGESAGPVTPTSWTCGCGHTNGINLARCATCTRKPGYDWERKEDNPCTWQ